MIINNNDTAGVSQLTLERASVAGTQASKGTGSAAAAQYAGTDSTPGDDSISLSTSPSLVQQALNSSSPERSARVQQLKALVQSNQYSPDAQEISRSIIQAHLTGI